jgi:hypothetical protein
VALAQFKDKKPCWTDKRSPSACGAGGVLKEAGVLRAPAFLAGHPAVVRAHAGGICDLGARMWARSNPGLEDELPDVTKRSWWSGRRLLIIPV